MVNPRDYIGKTSRYREAAYKLLSEGKPGDVLTLAELREGMQAGTLSDQQLKSEIYRARRKLERESKRWWKWDRDNGSLVCLDENQGVKASGKEMKKLNRHAVRTLQRTSCVDTSKLTADDKRQFDLNVAQAAMAKMVTSQKMTKQIESKPSYEPPKIGDIARLFGS